MINILQDAAAVQYRDESGQLGVAYTYRVGGVTAGGQEVQSNTQTITTGVYIDVGLQIEQMMVDPTRPYIYGIDRVNNSLHFINLTSNTLEKSIFVGSTPVDMDIDQAGTKLYVANFGSTEIAVVDLATRTLSGSIFVDTTTGTWDGNPYRLACTAGDTLVFTSEDQWNDLKLVNALTGGSLHYTGVDLSTGPRRQPRWGQRLRGESGISTQVLYRFDVVNGKLMGVDQSAGVGGFVGGTVLDDTDGKPRVLRGDEAAGEEPEVGARHVLGGDPRDQQRRLGGDRVHQDLRRHDVLREADDAARDHQDGREPGRQDAVPLRQHQQPHLHVQAVNAMTCTEHRNTFITLLALTLGARGGVRLRWRRRRKGQPVRRGHEHVRDTGRERQRDDDAADRDPHDRRDRHGLLPEDCGRRLRRHGPYIHRGRRPRGRAGEDQTRRRERERPGGAGGRSGDRRRWVRLGGAGAGTGGSGGRGGGAAGTGGSAAAGRGGSGAGTGGERRRGPRRQRHRHGRHGGDRDGGRGGIGGSAGTGANAGTGGSSPGTTIALAALSKDTNGVNMSWTTTPASAFATYRIYRNSAVINILQDAPPRSTATSPDSSACSYTYRVGGVTASGQEIQSNTQTIVTGVYVDVGSQIEAMMVDPTRPYVYGVDKVNNSLHFINLTTNTVEKSIFVGSSPVDLDINIQGTTLYVANFGSTQIAAVDLETRAMTGSIFVDTTVGTWDGNPYRIACTAGDTLVFTSLDQWNDLKLVNALTGAALHSTGSIYTPDLAASPDGTRLYVAGNFDGVMRFDIVGNMLQQVDSSGQSGAAKVNVTRDGRYVFSSTQKLLANNLKSVVGTFSETIVVVSSDGSLAVGARSIYDGNTFAVKRATLLMTSTMAISPDDTMLYLYDTTSSRIYLYRLK